MPFKLKSAAAASLPSCLPLSALLWLPVSAQEGHFYPLVRQVLQVAFQGKEPGPGGLSVGISESYELAFTVEGEASCMSRACFSLREAIAFSALEELHLARF